MSRKGKPKGPRAQGGVDKDPESVEDFDKKVFEFYLRCKRFLLKAKRWAQVLGAVGLYCALFTLSAVIQGGRSLLLLRSCALIFTACSLIISLLALLGLWLALSMMVGVAAALVFKGRVWALGVAAVFSLWAVVCYGSWWQTAIGAALAGSVFLLTKYPAIGVLLAVISSAYGLYQCTSLFGVLWTFLLSCICNELLQIWAARDKNSDDSVPEEEGAGAWGSEAGPRNKGSFSRQWRAEADSSSTQWEGSGEAHDRRDSSAGAGPSCRSPSSDASEAGPSRTSLEADVEIERITTCRTHYEVLELPAGKELAAIDVKKAYHQKARLVHPDKNGGCQNAGEAFKRLQNAYEVLQNAAKKKEYDEELAVNKLKERFARQTSHQFGRTSSHRTSSRSFGSSGGPSDDEGDEVPEGSKLIACQGCGGEHYWLATDRPKGRCRWCEECQKMHSAADGDGWFEQTSRYTFFGLWKQHDMPVAYACQEGKVYDVTEWVYCQGMDRCLCNTHKPTFVVNAAKNGTTKSRGQSQARGKGVPRQNAPPPEYSDEAFENMTEDEWFKFFDFLMRSGGFPAGSPTAAGAKGQGKSKPSKKQKARQRRQGW